jgi:hypothetical protein
MTSHLLVPLSPCGHTIYDRMVMLASRREPPALVAPEPSQEQLEILAKQAVRLLGRTWADVDALGRGPVRFRSASRRFSRRSVQLALRVLETQRLVVRYGSGARGARAYLVFATPIEDLTFQALLAASAAQCPKHDARGGA